MTAHCPHFASGCNFPEGECVGLCLWFDWLGGDIVAYRLHENN